MAAKCDVCRKMTSKYHVTSPGDVACSGTCQNALLLESWLTRMEERRAKDEAFNSRTFQQAREMSAWLSIYKYGSTEKKKLAAAAINAWAR